MNSLLRLAGDFRFWLVLFFVLRLYGITDPPLESSHNWRQTTVTMVARNFVEVDANIFYPRIDIAGEKTGITGMEFPLLNYCIYLVSKVFGYTHWYGRLINLLISSFGIWFFYRLVKKYFTPQLAFNAGLLLLVSIWFSISRKIIPDTFSMSLLLAGIYYGTNYLDRGGHIKDLSFYLLLMTLGVLAKLPTAFALILFLIPLLNKEIPLQQKIIFCGSSAVFLALPGAWYFYWVPHLVQEFGFWHFFMGKDLLTGIQEIGSELPQTAKRFYHTALKISGFLLFVWGIVAATRKSHQLMLAILGLAFAGFLVIIFKAGSTFAAHSYYIVPFVPIMALLGAFGLDQIGNKKIVLALLLIVGLEGILSQTHYFRIKSSNQELMHLEAALDGVSTRNDLILINSKNFPTPMYFAHRKGWIADNQQIANRDYVRELQQKGLKYIVILQKAFGTDINLNYEIVFESEHYRIYRLAD